ncbi:MAG: hypothetical protein K2O57_08390, partial [Acetatifactor sp.]|nr:hypothetical protein [Acetatifactor sp.]
FSNSAVIESGNLRVGSKMHPCIVEPEMRVVRISPLPPARTIRKLANLQQCLQIPPHPPLAWIPAQCSNSLVLGSVAIKIREITYKEKDNSSA